MLHFFLTGPVGFVSSILALLRIGLMFFLIIKDNYS